jgi:hypothetical protein
MHGPIPVSLLVTRSGGFLRLSRYGTPPGLEWLSMIVRGSQMQGLGKVPNASHLPVHICPEIRWVRGLASYLIKSQLIRGVHRVFLELEKSR